MSKTMDPSHYPALEHSGVGAMGEFTIFVFVFLVASAVIVPLFQRFKISIVLAYLLIGVGLGPMGIGILSQFWPEASEASPHSSKMIGHMAEWGVVFLLFSIGLEITFDRLKTMRRLVLGLGVSQILITSLVFGVMFYALGLSLSEASVLGMALSLSSTAVVLPVLADRKLLKTSVGRASFATLLAQDIALVPIMIAVTIVAVSSQTGALRPELMLSFVPALLGMGLILLLGRFFMRPLFNLVAESRSKELFMAACLLVVLGAGQISVLAGLSMGLGAFLAGMLLGETEYRREIEVMIGPFQGLLLGLFFVTVGARLDVNAVILDPVRILGLVGGILVIKGLILYGLARFMGLGLKASLEMAAVLAPAGEFAFVIIDQAMQLQVISRSVGQAVVLAAIISLLMIPLLSLLTAKALPRFSAFKGEEPSMAPDNLTASTKNVIVVGFGRVGELVCDLLGEHGIDYSVVDFNPKVTSRARARGVEAWYGDASHSDFLTKLGIMNAKAIVVTASQPSFTEEVVKAVRLMRSDILIVARARDAMHAERLYGLGVTDAVPETIEASLQLAENTLIDLGIPMGLVLGSIHERRDRFRQAFGVRDPNHPLREKRLTSRHKVMPTKPQEAPNHQS